jgi:hypothetical protein
MSNITAITVNTPIREINIAHEEIQQDRSENEKMKEQIEQTLIDAKTQTKTYPAK